MDLMEIRRALLMGIGGDDMPFGGNNLKYIIPIELTTPSTGVMEFYTGLKAPTEFLIGALFQPAVNDADGYTNKCGEFVFGTSFRRGASTAGYVSGDNTFYYFSTSSTQRAGNTNVQQWVDFTNPCVVKHSSYNVSSVSYMQNKTFKGFLLVFDTDYSGNASQKQLTDAGMSTYFSLTNPV